ncbi:MAG TPA: HipA family kinase [Bryobacteraceae bacterium]|nr:HipA family kinase [Bryobacteraceae bacterium]
MRGGAQAHLVEAESGENYVLKSSNNPQHRRILTNEWLSCAILRYLQIFVPDTALIELTPEFIRDNPELYISTGSKRKAIPPGIHFGSRLYVNPDRAAIFDFVPDGILTKLQNRRDFLGTLVFDKWVGNADSRQAVFFRTRTDRAPKAGLFAQMIDHGFAFNGPHWTFCDSPLHGTYFRTSVYDEIRSLDSFQPWLDIVEHFPVEVIERALKEIPPDWLQGDEHELEAMLEKLIIRRSRVCALINEIRHNRPPVFANWKLSNHTSLSR